MIFLSSVAVSFQIKLPNAPKYNLESVLQYYSSLENHAKYQHFESCWY